MAADLLIGRFLLPRDASLLPFFTRPFMPVAGNLICLLLSYASSSWAQFCAPRCTNGGTRGGDPDTATDRREEVLLSCALSSWAQFHAPRCSTGGTRGGGPDTVAARREEGQGDGEEGAAQRVGDPAEEPQWRT
jgi:hypothetical protein